jgi:hypothetical protein
MGGSWSQRAGTGTALGRLSGPRLTRETYWYLSASPELLNAAARSLGAMNQPSRPLLVGPLLQSFFSEHLFSHKNASIQTIASYCHLQLNRL